MMMIDTKLQGASIVGPLSMLDFTSKLTFASTFSYARWRATGRAASVTLGLKSGPRFELRPNSSGNNDYGVAYEVFVHEYYNDRGRIPTNVELIVDLGVNVGYSLLYFLHKWPNCRVIGFEPHPHHFSQAARNLVLDGSRARVQLYAQAAGARTRPARLTDSRSSSTVIETSSADAFGIEIVDIFPILEGKHIDILKMDIEGGEYEILTDDRFEQLDVDVIVMEWHSRGNGIEDKSWCERRLGRFGFNIEEIITEPSWGMFWAIR
jgi:FkbM family methyltransferase